MLEMKAEARGINGHFELEGARVTILLVEDDSNSRCVIAEMLMAFGHTVIEACDGDDAIAKFLAHKDNIHQVLMDIIMPRKSGLDAYLELKAIRPEVKIILMSGYPRDYLSGKLDKEEDVHFISKPFAPEALFEKIQSVLNA